MNTIPKTGVFLCKCGEKIDPLVNLSALKNKLQKHPDVALCEILPYPCLEPGFNHIIGKKNDAGLNRLVIGGCEGRLMLKKFEKNLESEGFQKGQIDMVNLRGHVAAVSDLSPDRKAEKAEKLIKASVAEMVALHTSIQENFVIQHPPMIVGGGIASFSAAQELARYDVKCRLALSETDPEIIVGDLYRKFSGERGNYRRLKTLIETVLEDPLVETVVLGELEELSGITGEYTLSFSIPGTMKQKKYRAGTILACLDGELIPPGPESGYDGKSVLCQTDFENIVWNRGIPEGQTVFWISDYESGQPEYAQLSARAAWTIARHILENTKKARVVILYNEQMSLPVSASERALGRRLGIAWVPYDKSVQPVLQAGYINFGGVNDHLEHELPWDRMVLSPIRTVGENVLKTSRILGIMHEKSEFLGIHHAKVRPEMVGREETYLAGSARYFCDINEALYQGKRAGKRNAEMMTKSLQGQLYVPQIVCVVDVDKCIGCGQCQELCDCNGIGVVEGTGGGLPRVVDPMLCTGGGTCAAACPYLALTLQNNTNDQREARIAALSREMSGTEFVAYACSWAGLPAADNAGNRGLQYNPNIHILGVPCIGQIDPSVLARAFLEGAPGLLLVGCPPEECHHSFGVDHAWSRVNLMKKLFTLCGIDRRRITLAHADLNRPEDFITTVESFSKTLASLGPIENNKGNQDKFQCIYQLVKNNARVRHLLSAGLRRPWESNYRGDQRYALSYDRDDFLAALNEEFLKTRLEVCCSSAKRPLGLKDLSTAVQEEKQYVHLHLCEMVQDGHLNVTYKNGTPYYLSMN